MRVLINIISSIALIIQSVFSVFNVLIMKKAETLYETLYNDFIFTSYLCSNIVVLVFLLLYNFKYKCLENRLMNVFSDYCDFGCIHTYIPTVCSE